MIDLNTDLVKEYKNDIAVVQIISVVKNERDFVVTVEVLSGDAKGEVAQCTWYNNITKYPGIDIRAFKEFLRTLGFEGVIEDWNQVKGTQFLATLDFNFDDGHKFRYRDPNTIWKRIFWWVW